MPIDEEMHKFLCILGFFASWVCQYSKPRFRGVLRGVIKENGNARMSLCLGSHSDIGADN